jgi:hypothetical protein
MPRVPAFRAPSVSYRLAVSSRILAAVLGGYALASACAAGLALLLAVAMPRSEAVLAATMCAWLAYALAIAWCFRARSAWRAWGGLLLLTLAMGAVPLARLLGAPA